MVVLDQDRLGQIGAMVDSAAAPHGILLQRSEHRRRLPRVVDARLRTGDQVHVARRQPATSATTLPAFTRSPSPDTTRTRTLSLIVSNAAIARGSPAITPGDRATIAARPSAFAGTVASVVTSSNARSSSRAARTSARVSGADNGKPNAALVPGCAAPITRPPSPPAPTTTAPGRRSRPSGRSRPAHDRRSRAAP